MKVVFVFLELIFGLLIRIKESIGRVIRIVVDCVKFGVVIEVGFICL